MLDPKIGWKIHVFASGKTCFHVWQNHVLKHENMKAQKHGFAAGKSMEAHFAGHKLTVSFIPLKP